MVFHIQIKVFSKIRKNVKFDTSIYMIFHKNLLTGYKVKKDSEIVHIMVLKI